MSISPLTALATPTGCGPPMPKPPRLPAFLPGKIAHTKSTSRISPRTTHIVRSPPGRCFEHQRLRSPTATFGFFQIGLDAGPGTVETMPGCFEIAAGLFGCGLEAVRLVASGFSCDIPMLARGRAGWPRLIP